MKTTDILFWNVDTQIDFIEPSGKLYVPGAELIKPLWKEITAFAAENRIRVVNTADYHHTNSAELSATPNFIETFPAHCMCNTQGAEYISETKPQNPQVVNWDQKSFSASEIENARDIVIRKDMFDVFTGNPFTNEIVDFLSPETVVVYGVTTNVCVNDAVVGLAKRVENVWVVVDAIKELPSIPLPFEEWKKLGVKMYDWQHVSDLLKSKGAPRN